ncbi:MAG: DUF1801 domain-containing protein [Planctomycetota bacterium]
MAPAPTTIGAYLAALEPDRRRALEALREVVAAHLDPRIEAGLQYGMPAWFVPHAVYPAGYHAKPSEPLPFASVASQKRHMALYLFWLSCDPSEVERFREEWQATGLKLDMGKSCVRFQSLEDVPLDVIGRAVARASVETFVAAYEASVRPTAERGPPARKRRSKS